MGTIWWGAGVMAALGVVYVVLGGRLRSGREIETDSAEALFAARMREIEAEAKANGLTPDQVAALEEELALELLDAQTLAGAPPSARRSTPSMRPLLFGAIGVAGLALGLYAWWGDPGASQIVSSFEKIEPDDTRGLAALVPALAARAERRPEDLNSWLHLASVRMRLLDYGGAADAFTAAHGLAGPDPQVDAAWAQARFLADGGVLAPETREIVARVLATAPNQPVMLELLAMGALRDGDFNAAARHLVVLLRQEVPPARRRLLAETLVLARTRQDPQRAFIQAQIDVAADATDAQWLMVFARPPGGGPPVAAARVPAEETQTVVLDDANVMAGAMPLSKAGEVEVVARLSRTGMATSFSAQAVSDIVEPASRPRVRLRLPGTGEEARSEPGIAVAVSIATAVAADTPVFVIARSPSRPRPPIAVRRLVAGELPARIVLTDADLMMPGQRLSAHDAVELLARASLGGTPSAQAGDLESATTRVAIGSGDEGADPVQLRIAHPVR